MENLVADGRQLGFRRRLDLDEEFARISRTDPGQSIVIAFKADVRAVGNEADAELCRKAAAQVASVRRTADEEDDRFIFCRDSGNGFRVQDGVVGSKSRIFDRDDSVRTVRDRFFGSRLYVLAGDETDDFLTLGIGQLAGLAQQFNAQRAQRTAGRFKIYTNVLFQFHNSAPLTASSWQSVL